ncbi:hypothetical protein [Desulfogranum marinum]|uniref:hypothetical protein n=1 Tax=Desulfogranum marinum TaxID=453220 RepID=UPI0029C6D06A|nr:hypothetical protein [Desulfogranum marinum]
MASPEDIEREFLAIAGSLISKVGFRNEIYAWILHGIDRIQLDGYLDNEDKISLAKANFQKMIDRAEQNVGSLLIQARSLDPDELQQIVIKDAFTALCPIWPFC